MVEENSKDGGANLNITFLIGNGFDINLGLKTRYTDFYPYYMSKNPSGLIADDIAKNYECWSDMEIALGQLLRKIDAEAISNYLDQKAQLEADLTAYLETQQATVNLDFSAIEEDFRSKITGFYKEFSNSEQSDYIGWQKKLSENITYQFISFNYTNILDHIVEHAKSIKQFGHHSTTAQSYTDVLGSVLHLHGTLQRDLILALDNETQIANKDLQTHPRLTRYIIKSKVNQRRGTQNTETAMSILDKSDYVCIYGMSLGETDAMWWTYLAKWLEEKDCRRLVLCAYETPTNNPSASESLRQQDKWRDKFLAVAQVDENEWDSLYPRIIVLIRSTIFDINGTELSNSETEKELISV